MMTLVTTITMTAVSRVSAAQPEASWLACESGFDTLFVHDEVRHSLEKLPLVRLLYSSITFYTNEILVLGAAFLNPILPTNYNVSARDFLQVAMMSIATSAISTVGRFAII